MITETQPLRLNFESVRKVVVEDSETGDKFVTTVREAAQACRSVIDFSDWKMQFEDLLAFIHEWADKNSDIVSEAYVGPSSEGLTGVIITRSSEYLLNFDDQVTDLDLELANRFPNCPIDVLQSPSGESDESRVPYIPTERALQIYGD